MTTPRTPWLNDHHKQLTAGDGYDWAARPTASWWRAPYCLGTDIETFFPLPGDEAAIQRALAICDRCPVRIPCRKYALSHRERHGIWGGLTEETRELLIRMGPLPTVIEGSAVYSARL